MAQTPGKFFLSASTESAHTGCEDGPWAGVGGGICRGHGRSEPRAGAMTRTSFVARETMTRTSFVASENKHPYKEPG